MSKKLPTRLTQTFTIPGFDGIPDLLVKRPRLSDWYEVAETRDDKDSLASTKKFMAACIVGYADADYEFSVDDLLESLTPKEFAELSSQITALFVPSPAEKKS